MIAYIDATGKIIGGVYAKSPDDLNGITRIPDGCTAVYVDDVQYPNVWTDMGEYTIQNGVPVFTPIADSVKLQAAQNAKLAQLEQAFNNSLLNGFTSTADGTSRLYPIDPLNMAKLTSGHTVINSGKVSSITIKDFNGNRVTLTGAQFQQMASDGFTFYNNQEQHLWNLEDQVKAATTVDAVNAIVW